MTDGSIIYTAGGDELKAFNVKDGLAVKSAARLGVKTAIIPGRNSQVVARRAKELEVAYLYQGVKDKQECLGLIMAKEKIAFTQVAAIGDDLNDAKMLQKAGLSATPGDGSAQVKQIVDLVLQNAGGRGAVREFIEYILKRDNLYEAFVNQWLCD
jgi:3-deoxy-D-manno-octulosonate 8-phosphate phosphatase (KDO 8-P phosphatase)